METRPPPPPPSEEKDERSRRRGRRRRKTEKKRRQGGGEKNKKEKSFLFKGECYRIDDNKVFLSNKTDEEGNSMTLFKEKLK